MYLSAIFNKTWIKTIVTMLIEYFCTKIIMETDTFLLVIKI